MSDKLIITPRTKVLQFIEACPVLENILISFVPAFSKLKNPVLRNTVARIATLQQAAAIGNIKVEDLINDLSHMEKGSIYKLIAPFLPAPIIDKAASLQIKHWLIKENDELFVVYFYK